MSARRLTRHWWLIPLMLLIAILAIDRAEQPVDGTEDTTFDMRTTQSDYYLEAFTTRKFDATGTLEYVVSGDTLAHYPHDLRSEIVAPHVTLHRPAARWQVSANRGVLKEDAEVFTFADDVVIVRESDDAERMIITTSELDVLPRDNIIRTAKPIEIRTPHWQLQSVGLSSAIDQRTLTLLSDVRARFDVTDKGDPGDESDPD